MNKREFAKIVQAWAEGETIQWAYKNNNTWVDIEGNSYPHWGYCIRSDANYRIKPKEITTMIFAYAHPHFAFKYSKMQNDEHNIKLLFTNNVLTNAEVLK